MDKKPILKPVSKSAAPSPAKAKEPYDLAVRVKALEAEVEKLKAVAVHGQAHAREVF